MSEQAKKAIYKQWWFWLIILVVIGVIGSFANRGSDDGQSKNNSQPAKAWVTVAELSGSDKEGFSKVFALSGGRVRVTYDIATTTKGGTVDSGNCADLFASTGLH